MLYHAIIAIERVPVKLLVINNLSSGFGEGAVYDFARSFSRDGDEVCLRSTDGAPTCATCFATPHPSTRWWRAEETAQWQR